LIDQDWQAPLLIFDDDTSELVEVDLRGTMEDIMDRLKKPTARVETAEASSDTGQRLQRGPSRPRLGVVSREVTLPPRHWDWLNSQP